MPGNEKQTFYLTVRKDSPTDIACRQAYARCAKGGGLDTVAPTTLEIYGIRHQVRVTGSIGSAERHFGESGMITWIVREEGAWLAEPQERGQETVQQ